MKPVYAGDHERCELRVSKTDRVCWTWQERDGAPEPDCNRMIGVGEMYMISTIYPGHDSGYADQGWRKKLVWVGTEITWEDEIVPARPLSCVFCLPCCERWTNLKEALEWIQEQRSSGTSAATPSVTTG